MFFFFGDKIFNVYRKDWLPGSCGTDKPVEQLYSDS